jgi:hypothetical protein
MRLSGTLSIKIQNVAISRGYIDRSQISVQARAAPARGGIWTGGTGHEEAAGMALLTGGQG